MRALYSFATWAAQPLLRRKLRRRGVAEPGYLHAVEERFGHYTSQPPDGDGPLVWVHAVSLGETRAAAILLTALISIVFLRMRPAAAVATFGETLMELRRPIYSIGMVLAFACGANYSGLSATLALALAHTGSAFTFFSPFLGWLGVFLTGSDTSANALFAALQANTAHQIGVSDVLLVAVNTTGGVTGKMISPQSIAIACAAVGLVGKESDLFRFTVRHSLPLCALVGVITTIQAYLVPWMIP